MTSRMSWRCHESDDGEADLNFPNFLGDILVQTILE